jgi:hypothetical protein
MAKKVNTRMLGQEYRRHAEITDRQPATDFAALSLLQVRPPVFKVFRLKRKLPITLGDETRDQIEHSVKIRHVA